MSKPVNVGARWKPAPVMKTNTKTASGDGIGLLAELYAAQDPAQQESIYAVTAPYTFARDRVRAIEADDTLTDLGRVARVRALIPEALGAVAESRRRVSRIRAQAHNARLAALRERERIVEERAAKDPEAVRQFVDVLQKLDPIVGRQRVQEAAAELGSKSERWPYLLAAARRAKHLGLESENPNFVKVNGGRTVPVIDDETLSEVDETLVSQASTAKEVRDLAEVSSIHESMLRTVEKSTGKMLEAYDARNDWAVQLSALPQDGGPAPAEPAK